MKDFTELVEIMHRLRRDCPWDRKQSLESLEKYLIEESYECIEAIHARSRDQGKHLVEELGDVLLQVLFQSEILSEETGREVIKEVVAGLKDKLVRRHPHVFGDMGRSDDADEVIQTWEKIKAAEKKKEPSPFQGIAKHMPAAHLSHEIGKIASKVDFDWDHPEEVFQKVLEEYEELKSARSKEAQEEEIGDLFFSLCQWARKLKINPELALTKANQKFLRRFQQMEDALKTQNKSWDQLGRDEKEGLWNEVKGSKH